MKASQNIEEEDVIEIPDDDEDIHANIVDHSSSSEGDICTWILAMLASIND